MNSRKAKSMAEMADYYGVTTVNLKRQIEHYPTLNKALTRVGFDGKTFYPKQQDTIIRILGKPT